MVEWFGEVLNGWVAALGGVAVVLALSSVARLYHEFYVRRMLRKIYVVLGEEGCDCEEGDCF